MGTEQAINYLPPDIDTSVIVSLDGLLALPVFRIHEKIIHILLLINQKTKDGVIIQTTLSHLPIIEAIRRGTITEFYREELKERELLGYPPYKTIITLTTAGRGNVLEKNLAHTGELLKDYNPEIFKRSYKNRAGYEEGRIVLKIPRTSWYGPIISKNEHIDEKLVRILMELSPLWRIEIDPEEIL